MILKRMHFYGGKGELYPFSHFPFEIFYNVKGPRKPEFSTPIFSQPLFLKLLLSNQFINLFKIFLHIIRKNLKTSVFGTYNVKPAARIKPANL